MNAPIKTKRIGRPRANKPFIQRGRYFARHLVVRPDGTRTQQRFDLGTTNLAVAHAKNAQIIARLNAGEMIEPPERQEIKQLETFRAAADRLCRYWRKDGMISVDDREQRLAKYAHPHIGGLRVNEVRTPHVQALIEKACDLGKSRGTLIHLRNDIKAVFEDLVRSEQINENPCGKFKERKIKIPKRAKHDGRPVQILTDEEFVSFVICQAVPKTIRMMALTTRMLGGMRTGELHAFDWTHIDTQGFKWAKVKRGKTGSWSIVELPDDLAQALETWWHDHRCPVEGPVFPVTRGDRRGERRGKIGYARVLRKYLLRAGVTRAELHDSNEWSKRVDFHSFRRAYASALGEAGVNHQSAMRLTGHTKLETHLRYVTRLRPAAAPSAAIPKLGPAKSESPIGVFCASQNHEKACENGNLGVVAGLGSKTPIGQWVKTE